MTIHQQTQTIAIEGIDQCAVETHIGELALLTLTNAEDWNFRFVAVGDPLNWLDKDLICFTHPKVTKTVFVRVAYFMREDAKPKPHADIAITFSGNIVLFNVLTRRAAIWISSHVATPNILNSALVCELRYAKGLAKSMKADGLKIA
jgi:hypothetical protein